MSLLLLVTLVGGGYLTWVWAPIYFEHYAVKQVVTDYMNQAVKNRDDEALRTGMVKKIATIASEQAVDAYGAPKRVPAIVIDERAVTWERDDGARTLRIAFDYERRVVYPLLERTTVKTFSVDKTFDITLPDWGPAR